MDEKNTQIAHRRMVAGRGILRNYARNNNSPGTGGNLQFCAHRCDAFRGRFLICISSCHRCRLLFRSFLQREY
jgi:hypothetical protein